MPPGQEKSLPVITDVGGNGSEELPLSSGFSGSQIPPGGGADLSIRWKQCVSAPEMLPGNPSNKKNQQFCSKSRSWILQMENVAIQVGVRAEYP